MSAAKPRATSVDAVGDALKRIRILERVAATPLAMPWLLLSNGLGNETIPGGGVLNDYDLHLGGLEVSPLNAGGTIDANIYAGVKDDDSHVDIETGGVSNEPFKQILLRSPGLFVCRAQLGWFTDWGPIRLNYHTEHDDGDDSFFVWDVFLMTPENTMITAPSTTKLVRSPTTTHNQYAVNFLIAFHVDERAVNPRIGFTACSDNAHTWNAHACAGDPADPTYDCAGFSVWFIRLSPFGVSNPLGG